MNLVKRIALCLSITVLAFAVSTALLVNARKESGNWGAREFQLQSLSSAPITVQITGYTQNGNIAGILTSTLAPFRSQYFTPNFPPNFTGTLVIDTDGPIASSIAHLEDPPFEIGNEIYETQDDGRARSTARLSLLEARLTSLNGHVGSLVVIHNRESSPISTSLMLYDVNGVMTRTNPIIIPVNGSREFDIANMPGLLPETWRGAGYVVADGAILVSVNRIDGATYETYRGTEDAGKDLVFPWVRTSVPGQVTSTVQLYNPDERDTVTATVYFTALLNSTQPFTLPTVFTVTVRPRAQVQLFVPVYATTGMAARVLANRPLLATARLISTQSGEEGSTIYAALEVDELTHFVAVPLLYDNYRGWSHDTQHGGVRLYNAGWQTATVMLTYRPVTQTLPTTTMSLTIAPRGVAFTAPPAGISPHWSLLAASNQPVGALVLGYRQSPLSLDHWFSYRGTPYTPTGPGLMIYLPTLAYNSTLATPPAQAPTQPARRR